MTKIYPYIGRRKKSNRELNRYVFWLKVTKWLHRKGWFGLSKFTARLVK